MLYLLWGLLNVGLFIFFLVLSVNAARLIREKFGILGSAIFVFGVVSFIGRSFANNDNREPGAGKPRTWEFHTSDSLRNDFHAMAEVVLEENLISTYSLGISYGRTERTQENLPINAQSWTTGFISGTSWQPHYILANQTENNQVFQYEVKGSVKWRLLGLTIYSQSKHWKGTVELR